MNTQPARRPFTTSEYHRLIEIGILTENDRVELLDGEVIEMAPIGPRHAACVDRLAEFLQGNIGKQGIIRVQSPIELSEHSEPEPDITVLTRRSDFYVGGHPTPADILIVIEVADATLDADRRVKLPAYARAGIPEVWLVNLIEDRIEVHSRPNRDVYQEIRICLRGDRVISPTLPKLKLKADDILV
ncbi:MAG: Uma2 family endonuclease [Acidobacteria bacterium]|nr:Uma2 family endonuclease [Acidobacteriota bacterium]MCW5969552.1 Uma2 family endonuclease [Blastocatellales bacterium]